MFKGWFLLAVSLAYVGVLFFIAWWGDRQARYQRGPISKPIIYSLSLAVYCTSWTFYGAVGQAATTGWDFLPVYLGPILMFLVFGGFMLRIVRVSKEQNITSISDFIASRFGKTQSLAVLVSAVAVLGILPYIALQLKAIAMGFNLLTADPSLGYNVAAQTAPAWSDTALIMALLLALFTILFGTRQLDATEHHPGLMLAIAFESLVKLLAFLAVGIFVTWSMFDGLSSVNPFKVPDEMVETMFSVENLKFSFLTIMVLSMLAMFCLPRQFHTAVVENTHEKDVRTARVLFPAYLVAIILFVVPVAVAGLLTFEGTVNADTFMLTLPMSAGKEGLTLLALLGGFSAATGMVIVAAVALSTMVSNDIVMPALLRMKKLRISERRDLGLVLLFIRRGVIVLLMLLAYLYYRLFAGHDTLAGIGLLSFAAAAQFGPLMIAGVFWRRANRHGAILGLSAGFTVWFYCLLMPVIMRSIGIGESWMVEGPLGIAWLNPEALFGSAMHDSLTHGTFWSLAINTAGLILGSLFGKERTIDQIQANAFVGIAGGTGSGSLRPRTGIATVGDFVSLTRRFLGRRRAEQTFSDYAQQRGHELDADSPADADLVRHTERVLAGVIGASSARIVLTSALAGSGMRFDDVVSLLDQTSQKLKFRQELLQSAMENLSEGISVIDGDLRLVAWNQRYLDLFDYPDGLVHIGRPIEEILYFNARRGQLGEGDVDELVARRMHWLRQGNPHFFERVSPDGRVIEIRGNPMPGGGFVTSFTDVTERKRAEEALRESERNIRIYTDNVPALLAYVDADQRFRFTNRAYEETLGLSREELIGRHLTEVFDEDDYARRLPHIEGVLAGERQSFELELTDAKGNHRYALATYIPQKNDHGTVLGYFALLQDITERRRAELKLKEAKEGLERRVADRTRELTELNRELSREIRVRAQVEEALRQAKSEAEEANLSKTRFLAAASHDLLQPLNAARLFASALSQNLDVDERQRHLVERLDGSLKSAEELLSALLDISRLDAGAMEPNIREFAIHELLEPLHAEFSVMARDKGLEFHLVSSRARVISDPKLLRRVLQNFLSNALRYTTSGRVTLGCRRLNGNLQVQVWDTGPGIPEHQLREIFQEFHRLNGSRQSQEKGLGLGLAIAERIARMLEHPIEVRSWPGKGTVFSLQIPIGLGQASVVSRRPGAVYPGQALTGLRVLCIDNEPDILAGMEALMIPWGCKLASACDGDEALEKVEHGKKPPDLILADYHLDDAANGIDVMDMIRSCCGRSIPGIVITADQTEAVRQDARRHGYRFLQKPLRPASLRALIRRLATVAATQRKTAAESAAAEPGG